MTRVLLITGARSLADDPAAEAWARGLIAEALAGTDLLIVGDAPGPDAWAVDIATSMLARSSLRFVRRYVTRGRNAGRVEVDRGHGDVYSAWWGDDRETDPLRRNAAMVRDALAIAGRGDTVSVLALLDGRKPAVVKPGEKRPTRGTEHTVEIARNAGLTVDARTWTPKGVTT